MFDKLNQDADIFTEIRTFPNWWRLFCNDKELYIDIRKDNYISVYYYGGSLAKISYKERVKECEAIINRKYSIDKSDKLNLNTLTKEEITTIKSNIRKEFVEKNSNPEKPAEKKIQGKIIKSDSKYIDSEFAFDKDKAIGKIRIDLVELHNNILSFVELKGITDNRLINDKKRNTNRPEILKQMSSYQKFIIKYEKEITEYYQKLLKLKKELGLINHNTNFTLNKTPKLIIVGTYLKTTKKREDRLKEIKELLSVNKIDFSIV